MPGDIIPFEVPKGLSTEMADLFGGVRNDLSEGVSDSFAVVSFKGKVWRVKFRGEEKIVRNKDGDPAPSLVAVIVKGSPQISKIFYKGTYTEGSDDAPDCFSIDGVRPDPGAANPQSPTCASCPKNVWGSKVTEQGNKTKACADSRRMAVVPYPDLKNEAFGGPLLLRVPPASLQELKSYSDQLQSIGMPYQAVITRISFDEQLAYPKLKFQAIKALNLEEAKTVKELMEGDVINRMLTEAPITEDTVTPSEAAHPGPAPAASEGPRPATEDADILAAAVAPLADAPAEPVSEAPTTASADTAAANANGADTGSSSKKAEKPSPKEANAVEANEVAEHLDGLIGTLL